MQRVRLQHLAVVHQATQLDGAGGHLPHTDDPVHRLGSGQVMGDRADAAQALHHHRDLPVGPALDEFLEAAELDDVQAHLLHMPVRVEQ